MIILYKLRPLYCNIKTEAVNRGDTKDSVVGRDSFYYAMVKKVQPCVRITFP